jgi:CheY-like chemotaxis protein
MRGRSREVAESHRLLVINRLTLLREIIAKHLRLDHHEVVTAADESEGLAVLRSGPVPCAILVDFLMPEAGGEHFVAELRRNPRWAGVPVVAMTGAFARAGADLATAHIQKPFRISELRELLERVCPPPVGSRDAVHQAD